MDEMMCQTMWLDHVAIGVHKLGPRSEGLVRVLVISIEDTLDDYAIGKIGDAIHRRKSKDH
jgi:hypothetical protein